MTEDMDIISQESHKAMLLNALQIHGEQFMHSFNFTNDLRSKRKRKSENAIIDGDAASVSNPESDPEGSEEWFGMSTDELECFHTYKNSVVTDVTGGDLNEYHVESGRSSGSFTKPKLIVFNDNTSTHIGESSLQPRSFMSSKVSKVSSKTVERPSQKFDSESENYEQQKSHIMNDNILQQLIHTRILTSSNAEFKSKPSQKQKELAGRILELTGKAKIGKGESIVREAEKKKAIRRIREGMERKRKKQNEKRLEEAKNTGDYHPIIKQIFDTSDGTSRKKRMRERGLKLGVGKFSKGVLKLRKDELASVQSRPSFAGRAKFKSKKSRS